MTIFFSNVLLLACVFAFVQFSHAEAELRLYRPGPFSPSNDLRKLKSGDSICLGNYPSGINIRCVGSKSDRMATFRIDGKLVKTERAAPFFIGGDKNGIVKKWSSIPKHSFVLECKLASDVVHIRLSISNSCDDSNGGPIRSKEPKPSKRPSRSSSPKPQVPHSPPSSGKDAIGCVIVGTKGVTLSKGWVRRSDGIAFLPHSSSTKLTPSGDSPVYFNFKAKKTGRHAFVVDLTTNGNSEHNDIWIWMEEGFALVKEGRSTLRKTGWIKGFQKLNGRGVALVSGDHDPYSIATWETLQAGKTYRFGIAGRSSKVVIHRSLLYVCEGLECTRYKGRHLQETCIPGSFPSRKK